MKKTDLLEWKEAVPADELVKSCLSEHGTIDERCRGKLKRLVKEHHFLMLRTTFYRWNAKGSLFYQIRQKCQHQYEELSEGFDLLKIELKGKGITSDSQHRQYSAIYANILSGNQRGNTELVNDLMYNHQKMTELVARMLSEYSNTLGAHLTTLLRVRAEAHTTHYNEWKELIEKYSSLIAKPSA